jgi:hypothetical protein
MVVFNLPFISTSLFSVWNIVKFAFHSDTYEVIEHDVGVLKVLYPNGSYSPSAQPTGGIGFFASPQDIFFAQEVIFNYSVLFDETFDPMFGGKLPGLYIGNDYSMIGASGGKHINDTTASCRIAWRAGFGAEAYVYLPTKDQHDDYLHIPGLTINNKYGDSLWRNYLSFNSTIWNNVSIHLKLNTFNENTEPVADGFLSVTINNMSYSFDKMLWRTKNDYFINSILFGSFFGGSSKKYATPHDTWTYFKDVSIEKID